MRLPRTYVANVLCLLTEPYVLRSLISSDVFVVVKLALLRLTAFCLTILSCYRDPFPCFSLNPFVFNVFSTN
ncbi:hypothetical protein L596_022413 [Steinernema carpocapsae]|uniref:Uncharacterized protein n=1 Tax=Steinernema carpocapsae TaxID=34508 RepID=A0A4U5MLL2_STECR|nr:hypothetical protein L596_022413 [Steinernema carpocapsae]